MPAASIYQNPRARLARNRWSHGLAALLCLATLVLLMAGALVTGTGSSLAVPDWPLAYGQVFPPMVGGILFEHGHRMVAATVGLITVLVGGWLWWAEERRWVRGLGLAAVALVIAQGVLGGMTVLFLLPKAVSISHALVAQLFFLVTVTLYQVTAPRWRALREGRRGTVPRRLKVLGMVAVGLLLLELLLGATVRHNAAGLAIPDFPLAYGRLIPPLTAFPVLIHFLHRVGALLVLLAVAAVVWETARHHRGEPLLFRPALALAVLAALQVLLGALVIWTQLAVPITTLHVVNGALLTGTTWLLTLRALRLERVVVAGN